ncbi:hypothetical protein [Amycolatopsis vastitatis]|uniref:DUF2637 domain-containing protein n=1 Tax=Amycolatopsis vastitatis TaxID=1905142 RepID=A0A229SJX4_9PSEU|nr:hypothetical protein [Amycolatopsis vastitatis]OXM59133.1 hypothetical protein CF165_49290 [Amycolatopsis vastitatis]
MTANARTVSRFVTVVMGLVIGLTFLFGFGNVLNLALKLQVPVFVAPLVAPAVDLTVLGLLVGTRHLALSGADDAIVRPARRLLLAASVVTLLLNVADPVCAGLWGKAAFDSVGPLLLIGWAETGPGLLRALTAANASESGRSAAASPLDLQSDSANPEVHEVVELGREELETRTAPASDLDEKLVERARRADAEHWRRIGRPISAETLRKQLRVGATTSRILVARVRAQSAPVHT